MNYSTNWNLTLRQTENFNLPLLLLRHQHGYTNQQNNTESETYTPQNGIQPISEETYQYTT